METGQQLLHYRLTDKLGEGGMGVVWKAIDTNLDREVAIKILPELFARDPERLARFEREAKLLASLNHPNIATVHGLHECDGQRFLAMELVQGEDLAVHLAQGSMDVDEALKVGAQVAAALEAAHSQGVVHRDLKPANVVLTPEGVAKVLDFGLAKVADPSAVSGATSIGMSPTITSLGTVAGMILGTAAYMSPEQARGKPVDRRTDMWSFGCLLHECLTGKQLFRGETVSDSLAAILRKDPDWSDLPTRTPPLVRLLLRRSLNRDPRQRLQDAGDARIELEQAIEDPQSLTLGFGPAEPGSSPWRWLPWGLTVAALATALALMIGGGDPDSSPAPRRHLTATLGGAYSIGVDWTIDAPPMVSPDGRLLVAGVHDEDGTFGLSVRALNSFEAKLLPGTTGARFPFWSPDSKHLGFFRGGKLMRVELATDRQQTIDSPGGIEGRGASWNQHGQIIFAPNSNSGIQLIDEAGGELTPLTRLDPTITDCSHRWPQFLPDGEHFVYTLWSNDLEARARHGGIYLASLDGDQPTKLSSDASRADFASPDQLLFVSGGTLVSSRLDLTTRELAGEPRPISNEVMYSGTTAHAAFSVSQEGTLVYETGQTVRPASLVWYERSGDRTPVGDEAAPYQDLRLSPEAGRAAVVIYGQDGDGEIWFTDLERRVRTRAIARGSSEVNPVWSADGGRLYFASQATGTMDLYSVAADGSGDRLDLLLSEHDKDLMDVSTDGRHIAYWPVGTENSTPDIWIHDTQADRQYRLITGASTLTQLRFSHDSRYAAYVSDESGDPEVFVQALSISADGLQAGARWQLSVEGGASPIWRRDGREIAYVSQNRKVMSVSVGEVDGRLILGQPRELFEIGAVPIAIDATSDLKRFLIATTEEKTREPLRVILNWMSE